MSATKRSALSCEVQQPSSKSIEQTASPSVPSASASFDDLPDELLLLVLGYIEDGVTLLDCVALVCKRWCRVSRDPRAWAGVVVTLPTCFLSGHCEYERGFREKGSAWRPSSTSRTSRQQRRGTTGGIHERIVAGARVLLHAPSLRRLELDWGGTGQASKCGNPLQCAFELHFVLSALRRSGAALHELWLPDTGTTNDWMLAGMETRSEYCSKLKLLLELMTRSRHTLRSLRLGLLVEGPLSPDGVEDILSQLPQLQELSLWIHILMNFPSTITFKFTRQLEAGALANLRRLEVHSPEVRIPHYHEWSLVIALLGSAAGSLRELRFLDGRGKLPDTVAAAVRGCEGLRVLACNMADAALLPALPGLGELSLSCGYRRLCDEFDWAALTEALVLGGPHSNLRHLRVALQRRGKRLLPTGVKRALLAVASAACDVTSVDLDLAFQDYDAVCAAVLDHMTSLRCVELRGDNKLVGRKTLAALSRLQHLEALTLHGKLPGMPDKVGKDPIVLGVLRRLRSLKLGHPCSIEVLDELAELAELRSLSAKLKHGSEGVPPDECSCQLDIAEFKRKRPEVEVDISVMHSCIRYEAPLW